MTVIAASFDRDRPTADAVDLRPAYCLAAAPVACALAAVSVGIAASDQADGSNMVVQAGLILAWAAAGAVLGVRRRHERLGPIVLAGALAGGIAAVAAAAAASRDANTAGLDLTTRLATAFAVAVFFHLLLALPDGRLVSSARRAGVVAGYVVAGGVGVGLASVDGAQPVWPFVLLIAAALGAGIPAGSIRYRVASAVDRRRMQWIGCALAIAIEVLLVAAALHLLADWPAHLSTPALVVTGTVPLALAAGTHAALIARIDRVLTHTVALAGLTALVVSIYVVVILGFGRTPEGNERTLLLLSMVAAAIAALAYNPARERLTDGANRLVYGERVAPDETLRTFGHRMSRAIPLDELLLQLVESLRKTMNLRSAEVWTGTNGVLELSTGVPHRTAQPLTLGPKEVPVIARAGISGGTWIDVWVQGLKADRDSSCLRVAPLAHAGELLGLIVLERDPEAENFSEADDLMVTDVARQVGVALHNVQLDSALQASLDKLRLANDELRSSRARIVAAGDAERRRLERNLHDGAQQYLVAMAVKIRLAHDAVEDGEPDAVDLLDELTADMQAAIGELRALAHGIFPPQLVSGGLAEALPSAAARATLPTSASIETDRRHASDVEAAVYFCVLEALQNASKHAGAQAEATIRVWEDDSDLRFSVHDDGAGFIVTDGRPSGQGFVNMADRLGAYGGEVVVTSTPGAGTTVTGVVPIRD